MTIKKFSAATKEEAIALAKSELGEAIVIMNTRDRKPEGIFGIFKKSIVEVTVALEDEPEVIPFPSGAPKKIQPQQMSSFTAVADENIDLTKEIPVPTIISPLPSKKEETPLAQNSPAKTEDWEGAFREISEVISNTPNATLTTDSSTKSGVIKNKDIHVVETAKLAQEKDEAPAKSPDTSGRIRRRDQNQAFVKMIYKNLMENEVDERYINQILDDMGNILSSSNSVEYLISKVYEKMVLKMGKPHTIHLSDNQKLPQVVFFIGPTGVGKTTTIAKIASAFKFKQNKNVAFVTADTYRIAAEEQLNEYANIMDVPIAVALEPKDINVAIEGLKGNDLILVDTVGFSHKNTEQKDSTKQLIDALDEKYKKDIFLVLSATTKYRDLREIIDIYKTICNFNLIFTKLDETSACGNILNIKLYSGASLSYVTDGQTVPDDIEVMDAQKVVKQFLGGS